MPTANQINPLAYLSQFTGFDPQGGYAVINDAGKLFANAMAEYEARSKNPRNDIYGRILPEDTDAALKSELIDPILYRFGLNTLLRPGAAAKNQVYHVGDALVERDAAGNLKPVYNAPAKPEKELAVSIPMQYDILGKPSGILKTKPSEVPQLVDSGIIPKQMLSTNAVANAYYNIGMNHAAPKASTPTNAVPTLSPTGFMGIPGGTNLFTSAVQQGKKAVESGANPAAGTRQIGRFTVKSK